MQNYKELKVWEKSHAFTLKVYEVTKVFPKEEVYALTNQVRRAASSIPANIAEGGGKNSKSELAHFLNVALAFSKGGRILFNSIKRLTIFKRR
jgi:four helix bundle protein